jgi:hypothetical protein
MIMMMVVMMMMMVVVVTRIILVLHVTLSARKGSRAARRMERLRFRKRFTR